MPLRLCSVTHVDKDICQKHLHGYIDFWVQFCIGVVQCFDQGLGITIFTQLPQMTPPSDLLFEVIERHVHVFSTVAIYVFQPFSVNP